MENERKGEKFYKTEVELNAKNKRLKLHFIYVSIILITIIVTILSLHFYSDDLNSKFIGYAATISSLILSVLAIIITVISNDSTNGLMHKIRDIYDAISATPEKISNSVECITLASDNLDNSVKTITEVSDKVENLSSIVNDNLIRLKESNDELYGSLKLEMAAMSSKLDQRSSSLNLYNENSDGSKNSTNGNIKYETANDIEVNFKLILSRTSSYGLVVLYASYISFKNKMDLDLEKLANAIVLPNLQLNQDYAFKYYYGYFMGVNIFQGLMKYEIIDNIPAKFKILDFNKEFGDIFEEKGTDLFLDMEKRFPGFFKNDLKDAIIQSIIKL